MFNINKATNTSQVLDLIKKYDKIFKTDSEVRVLRYSDLDKIEDISEYLDVYPRNVLYYQTDENFGHWCCFFKDIHERIYFFDSYGLFIDDILTKIPKNINKKFNQDVFYLNNLLLKEIYQGELISYNDVRLQKPIPVSTCGLYVALILGFCRIVDIDDFIRKLSKMKDVDQFVVEFSNFIFEITS